MNIAVLVFFFHNVLATLLLGGKFATKKDGVLKNFGIALLLNAGAFAIWSIAAAIKPENLESYVMWGTAFFIASLLFFLISSSWESKNKQLLIIFGVILGAIALYVRTFMYPSTPGFSEEGFFFFNPHPVFQAFYIFALLLAAIPAINAVASKLKPPYAELFRYGFIAEVAGGVILLTSNINNPSVFALNITGWIIGLVYLILWTTFVFNRKVWQ